MKFKLSQPLKIWQINQPFGANFNSFYTQMGMKGHSGIDFYALDKTPVYASHSGRVIFAGYDSAGGLGITIRTEKQFDYKEGKSYFKTLYWHLKKNTLKVTGGQTVKVGDLIALADNTGRSTGSHLHFGLKPIARSEDKWLWYNIENNGYNGSVDPMPYFDRTKYVFKTFMKFGTRSEEVKELQKALYIGPVDGIFGKITKGAVHRFQHFNNLVPDGLVGPLTRAVLNK